MILERIDQSTEDNAYWVDIFGDFLGIDDDL